MILPPINRSGFLGSTKKSATCLKVSTPLLTNIPAKEIREYWYEGIGPQEGPVIALKALKGDFTPRRDTISAATQDRPISESKERSIRHEKAETSASPIETRFANSITALEGAIRDLL